MASVCRPDTSINLKISFKGQTRRFKLQLRELVPPHLPEKIRHLLDIPSTSELKFERYSDTFGAHVLLDPKIPSSYKQLYRAARAKLRLRLRVTVVDRDNPISGTTVIEEDKTALAAPFSENSCSQKQSITISSTPAPTSINDLEKLVNLNLTDSIHQSLSRLHINEKTNSPTGNKNSTACLENMIEPNSNSTSVIESDSQNMKLMPISATQNRQPPDLNKGSCDDEQPSCNLTVICNNCNSLIFREHYHCSNCDDGDYDLCQYCVDNGVICENEDHWLIKRFIKNGKAVNSTTETIAPKSRLLSNKPKTQNIPDDTEDTIAGRICNSCVEVFDDENFVTCTTCPDYDLCISCHLSSNHGHNPKHAFEAAVKDKFLDTSAKILLAPGRNIKHAAVCDGCNQDIYGVRNKCLQCPDWDFCSTCFQNASTSHPHHRFVPLYEPIDCALAPGNPNTEMARHEGVLCDGPLCKNGSSYICGERYKCVICDDTDFCANCEANPANLHNRTHPLIKLRTPVRDVGVTILGDHQDGQSISIISDKLAPNSPRSIENTMAQSSNAATQVQTIFDFNPSETLKSTKAEIRPDRPQLETYSNKSNEDSSISTRQEINAHFVCDVVNDGTKMLPNVAFAQTWYLRNAGEISWPSGCFLKFVGGVEMSANHTSDAVNMNEIVKITKSTISESEVAPGDTFGFTVLMKTPSQVGNFISYWRLTTPDDNAVGPRLWCDINVVNPEPVNINKAEQELQVGSSQMIFPRLEKEIVPNHNYPQSIKKTIIEEDDFDDLSSEKVEDDATLDSSLTDDEYDILDASDEEFVAKHL